ncbi:hypothetical protein J421_5526 (plasmid) [Gemmatirosa kalamazoonensis]|uniref:PqqD family protein n=1 Tax=Gemmatirosa kalamazoonensis TaxID=861299 RepID=W0RQS0_9BACT|nr:PqqD family protein [Gemmatirosa kalamazoonensis]AHG93061.1 hypothetical protein J421_5526 [Gemmatirosa kalamazoonensis]
MIPLARTQELHVEHVDAGCVVYDLRTDAVHSLNAVTTFVWEHCTGSSTVDAIAAELGRELEREDGVTELRALVWLAIAELERAQLMERAVRTPIVRQVVDPISRRRATMKMGRAALLLGGILPAVKSIVAPTPAAADSTGVVTGACTDLLRGCDINTCTGTCKRTFDSAGNFIGCDCV